MTPDMSLGFFVLIAKCKTETVLGCKLCYCANIRPLDTSCNNISGMIALDKELLCHFLSLRFNFLSVVLPNNKGILIPISNHQLEPA